MMLIVYGKGVPAIAEDLHVDIEKAQEIKDSILDAFPDLKAYLDHVVEYCKKTGYVKTFYGRKRRLPDIQLDEYTFEFLNTTDEQTQKYYKGLYLGKLKRCKKLSEKTYIINQALSKGIKIHQNGGLIAKATRESYNCVDEETEILTNTGWKYYNEISIGEKILSYNMQAGLVEWDIVKDIHIYVKDDIEVVEFSQPNFSAVATHNHRWVVYDKDTEEVVIKTTDDLQSGKYEIFNVSCELLKFGKYNLASAYVSGRTKVKQGKVTTTNLVWCPTTRNSTWIARRNNTVYVTKNSPIQGCEKFDTPVLSREYGLTQIQDVADKNITIWDGENFVKASCVYSGKKQLVRITFTDNRIIECSPNHKFLITTLHGKTNFYSAEELSKKPYPYMVVISNEVGDFNCLSKQDFPSIVKSVVHNAHNYSFDIIKDGYELGYILGWLHSDGLVRKGKDCVWIFAENKYEIMPFVQTILEKYFCVSKSTRTAEQRNRNQDITYLTIGSKSLANQALEMGIKHHVPQVIFKSKQAMRGFIQACLDADDIVNKDNIIFTMGKGRFYEQFARELQVMLSCFGILSRLHFCKDAIHVSIVKKDVLSYYNTIGTRNTIKKEKMESIIYNKQSIYPNTIRIKSIEITNEYVDMYDIVNSESHKFVSNGVVTHNSAADITKKAMLNIATNERLKELGAEMVLTIHDETMTSVPRENAYEAAKLIEKCSIDAGEGLGAPLRCDIAISDRWEGQQYTFDDKHNLIPLKDGAI